MNQQQLEVLAAKVGALLKVNGQTLAVGQQQGADAGSERFQRRLIEVAHARTKRNSASTKSV